MNWFVDLALIVGGISAGVVAIVAHEICKHFWGLGD